MSYTNNLIFDEINIKEPLKKDLFSNIAESIAKELAKNRGQNKNASSQIRRFYDELLMWQQKIGNNQDIFENSAPFIQMIIAKTAYAHGRKVVDENFLIFIKTIISQIDSPKTLNIAKLFFEAVLGFMKALGEKE